MGNTPTFSVPNVFTSSAANNVALVSGSTQLQLLTNNVAAKLLGFYADVGANASTSWVQVFDGYGAPAGGAVPILSIRTAATSQVVFNPQNFFVPVTQGIVVALSSTGPTYTAIGTNYLFLTAFWTF